MPYPFNPINNLSQNIYKYYVRHLFYKHLCKLLIFHYYTYSAYRGHMVRKEMEPLLKEKMSQETKDFIKFYYSKWRSKSMFQVLLRYRAARYQDFVQLSQQVLPLFLN